MKWQSLLALILALPVHACGDREKQLVQNGKAGKLMKIRGFKLRTGAPLDTHLATLQSLRVRTCNFP
jgi:hypothetical protein